MANIADGFESLLPCRKIQIQQILNYIGNQDEPIPPCLFLYGSTSTGKSACVKEILKYLNYNHVIINAIECYSQKIFYETILNTLFNHSVNKENKYNSLYNCDNMKDFIIYLNKLDKNYGFKPIVIVVDKAEKLRSLESNILSILLRLNEFSNINICTILLSNVIFEKYFTKNGLREPIKIFFPQYTRDELYKIILMSHEDCCKYMISKNSNKHMTFKDIERKDIFANYLNAFLSVFFRPCRDIVELKYMVKINYAEYCEPINNGSISADDITKLWRNIGPILKTNLEILYLRLNTQNNIEVENKQINFNKHTQEIVSTKTFAQNFELPFYAKYLLIAAYLASFNPQKEDKRLFMKYHGKQKKKLQQVNAKAQINEKLNMQLGPKPFTLDRLLAIFYAIIDERVGFTANLLIQVSSLVSLRLLTTSTDSLKYKCTVGYDFILIISNMVGFNIQKYLYDFI